MSSAILSLTLVLSSIAGCGTGDDGIRSYEVAKTADSKDDSTDTKPLEVPATTTKQRMLAAMLPSDSQMWFVKLTGDAEDVSQVAEQFDALVRSLKPTEDDIEWTLPDGWTEQPGNQFRFATLIAPAGEKQLEVSVSKLPYRGESDEEFAEYIKDNVNRWRDQMQIAAEESLEISAHAEELVETPSRVLMVDLTGDAPAQMARPPFAGTAAVPARPLAAEPLATGPLATGPLATEPSGTLPPLRAPATEPFESVLPEGWSRAATRPMTMAIYATSEPDAEVAVSQFPAAGKMSDKLWNINRWRGQVGLPEITADEVDESMTDMKIDGQPARLIALFPESDDRLAIVVAMLEQDDMIWFYKLNGKASAVKAERQSFENWLATIKFPPQTAE